MDEPDPGLLQRRLDRERAARHEAETIAERATAELYASQGDLRRANAELRLLNDTMREFVAVASHDLRGPLTAVVGMASLLASRWEDIPPERRAEMLDVIVRQGHRLSRLVDDLLTVSKIESGALDAVAEVVALDRAVREAAADFADAEIRLTVDGLAVVADPDHLQRILVNYLGNALKYGEPPVEVDARDAGEWVEIRVCDHGAGVPEELVPRLFGKFARGAVSAQKGGTGLGLSIVQGLARANGGDTWYEPNQPCGSCFGVRLPARAS